MTKKITIIWGSQKQKKKTAIHLKQRNSLKYFMMGVDEAEGWLSYENK